MGRGSQDMCYTPPKSFSKCHVIKENPPLSFLKGRIAPRDTHSQILWGRPPRGLRSCWDRVISGQVSGETDDMYKQVRRRTDPLLLYLPHWSQLMPICYTVTDTQSAPSLKGWVNVTLRNAFWQLFLRPLPLVDMCCLSSPCYALSLSIMQAQPAWLSVEIMAALL